MPGTLSLLFDLDLIGGHENNYLVQNVPRALIDHFVVKYAGTTIQDTNGYDIYEIFKDLFLSMLLEGIQTTKLNKIRSGFKDKATSGADDENKLKGI